MKMIGYVSDIFEIKTESIKQYLTLNVNFCKCIDLLINYLAFQYCDIDVLDEYYSRNASHVLN